jgi:hypothetical protein
MNHDLATKALNRLLAIENFCTEQSSVKFYSDFLREYFRRASIWRSQLKCEAASWPFFDIPFYVDPSIRANRLLVDEMLEYVRSFNLSDMYIENIFEWYLHWNVLKDLSLTEKFSSLESPYEPLIIMYENGVFLYPEHGAIGIPGGLVFRGKWTDHLDKPPLESPLLIEGSVPEVLFNE